MITKEEMQKIASLARLALTPEEVEKFQKDFADILAYFDVLKKVDVEGVDPLTHPLAVKNVLRQDIPEAENPIAQEHIAKAALEQEQGYVKVPGVFQ